MGIVLDLFENCAQNNVTFLASHHHRSVLQNGPNGQSNAIYGRSVFMFFQIN